MHAFPNAKLNDTQFPIQVQSLQSLSLNVTWNYDVGNSPTTTLDVNGLTTANLNANVALDMFLSNNQSAAGDPTAATHEVMLWLGRFGPSTDPLGYTPTPAATQQVGGVNW